MSFDPQPFRQQYRAAIRPGYNPWLHAGFVLAYGGAWIVFFLSRLEQPSLLEWLTVPAALVFFNWGEYRIHKSLGHHKHPLGRMFYKRHTGDHHSFFVAGQMRYEQARDWRVILFPAWLVVVFSLGALLAWSLLGLLNDNLAALFAATCCWATSATRSSTPANTCRRSIRSAVCRGSATCAACTNCITVAS